MGLEIPQSLKREHEELHSAMAHAQHESGALGEAARHVARLLDAHFAKEENYVLPALGALAQAARGEVVPGMREVVVLADRLRNDMDNMLAEHRMISAAIEEMVAAAKREDKVEYAELGLRIIDHAQQEEQLTYPALLVLGEYLRHRLDGP